MKVSTDGGATFSPDVVTITGTGGNNAPADSQWSTGTLNLTGYTSASTVIQFVATADLRNRPLYIDDVVIKKGAVVNSIDAKAKGPFGELVTATATAPVTPGTPSLAITKEASTAGPVSIDGTFTYTVTVKNTGTVTQTGLVVNDTLPAGLSSGTVTAVKPSYTQTAQDDFGTTRVYTTGTGWALNNGPWTEVTESDGATAGKIQVVDNVGVTGSSLYFDTSTLQRIQRKVDLGGAASATIEFQCRREEGDTADDTISVYVSGSADPFNASPQIAPLWSNGQTTTTDCPAGAFGGTITRSITNLVDGSILEVRSTGNKKFYLDKFKITSTYPSQTVTAGNPPTLTSAGGPYILDPGKTVTFTIPVKVTGAPADGFQFSNVAQATSQQQTTPVSASVTTPYRLTPSFDITKTAIETWVNPANRTVTYRFEIRNTGNTDLTFDRLSDLKCDAGTLSARSGDLNSDDKLQVGEIWTYSCTKTFSETELTTQDGNLNEPDNVPNRVDATFKDASNVSVTDFAEANVKVLHPSIALTVDPASTTILTGGTVSYTYTLDNTGDVAITNPAVTAANCQPVTYSTGDTDLDGLLDIDETWTFTCTTGALTSDQTSQLVTATGKALIFATPLTATKNVDVNVINPKIAVVKVARDNGTGTTGDSITVGYNYGAAMPNSVTYLYDVTNTGDVALKPVVGTDNKCAPVVASTSGTAPFPIIGDTDADTFLDPAEVWSFTCGPLTLGEDTTNTVQFDAQYSVGGLSGTTSASDTAHVTVRKPALRLTKSAEAEFVRLGGQVPYTYVVTNTGSTSFTTANLGALTDDKCSPVVASRWLVDRGNNQVLDPPIAPDPANPNDTGTPGDAREYTCTATITAGMVVNGTVTNTVTMAASTDQYGSSYTPMPSSAMVFVTNPGFTLTKLATAMDQNNLPHSGTNIDGEAGKPVTYTFTIAHTITTAYGDNRDSLNALALTISDPRCDAGTLVYVSGDTIADSQLNPGETWVYTCTLASLPSGDPTVNTVTVVGTVVNRSLNPDGTPAAPNDGLGPITRTATATVTPFGRVVTVLKRGLHCDVGVPTCVSTFEGSAFMVYKSDPTVTPPPTGVALTSSGGGTFVTQKLQLNADYWLVETTAPDGFQLLPQPIKFHLAQSGLTLDAASASGLITADGPSFTITITDVPAAELPKVGGDGPWPFLGGGLALLLGAGLYLLKTSGPQPAPRRVAP